MKNSAFIRLLGETDTQYEDIYTTYGVSFVKGSYFQLVIKSDMKDYVTNNSRLSHGVQMLAKPQYAKYNSRSFSLTCLIEAVSMSEYVSRLEAFTDRISQGLFFLKVPSRHRVFKLVYKNIKPKEEFRGNRATFTIELTEPNPEDRVII